VALPLHWFLLPRVPAPRPAVADGVSTAAEGSIASEGERRRAFLLLATIGTLAALTSSLLSVHLLVILQDRGLELAAAVALGALIGPSQVGARVVEMSFGSHYHPLWTMLAANFFMASGIALLLAGFPIIAIALVLYGGGNGI